MFVCMIVSFMLAAFGLVGQTAASLVSKDIVGIGTFDGGCKSSPIVTRQSCYHMMFRIAG